MPDRRNSNKVIPRNLTALADIVVEGNPVSSRLETGVDNCYPGLEFDQRNLDKRFFPGLVFEFHRDDGAILRSAEKPKAMGLKPADFDKRIYIVGLAGQFGFDPTVSLVGTRGLGGLEVWRLVHDLQGGPVLVVISPGPKPMFDLPSISRVIGRALSTSEMVVERKNGALSYAVYVGERARYLDDNGVIDPDTYRPGELSQSLCVPWQYDFRDCGCWYWASNKPDVVSGEDRRIKNLDFMRDLRGSNRDEPDVPSRTVRNSRSMNYVQMMTDWQRLAIVLDDQEGECFEPDPAPSPAKLFDRAKTIAELRRLATIEHALCVEYLYAHYSLDAPRQAPSDDSADFVKRRYQAADAILKVAIDEMRHLRWVNQALRLLEGDNYEPALGRAEEISGRLNQKFKLRALLPSVLQEFVDIEAPSRVETDGLDGMYVRILRSIREQPKIFGAIADELIGLIKLIIDEGEDHFERFSDVQRVLARVPEPQWYRPSWRNREWPGDSFGQAIEAEASEDRALQELSDLNYAVMLRTLRVAFASESRAVQEIIVQARRAMFNMNEANQVLVERGQTPLFNLPAPMSKAIVAGKKSALKALPNEVEAKLESLSGVITSPELVRLFREQKATIDDLINRIWSKG